MTYDSAFEIAEARADTLLVALWCSERSRSMAASMAECDPDRRSAACAAAGQSVTLCATSRSCAVSAELKRWNSPSVAADVVKALVCSLVASALALALVAAVTSRACCRNCRSVARREWISVSRSRDDWTLPASFSTLARQARKRCSS